MAAFVAIFYGIKTGARIIIRIWQRKRSKQIRLTPPAVIPASIRTEAFPCRTRTTYNSFSALAR